MEKDRITIAHLYPVELNLYGDGGNILCLKSRLERRNIRADIIEIGQGDGIPDFDLMFIGGGQDREMSVLKHDIRRKSEALGYAIESGKVIFAVCGGYQLLGEYYKTASGETIRLSGALPFYTEGADKRITGNLVFKTPFGTAAGFENHSGRTQLCGLSPLGRVISGSGNNGLDETEGLLYKNTFATYAHGPLLPKFPALADELLTRAADYELSPLDDGLENRCRKQLINRFK
ncbi:MAG: glutamine amidotransferase [Eubacterium sp.]|nr:glutamine amidotransferase [Eubacterium sp.]